MVARSRKWSAVSASVDSFTSTFLNLVVVPLLFARWGEGVDRMAAAAA